MPPVHCATLEERPAGLRVLVVDDELLIRWSIVETLTQAGHLVDEAGSARQAIEAVSGRIPPDVVLLDFRLPDSVDLTLLTRVRQLAPRAAVIFMTAYGTHDVIDGARQLGAFKVLNKPFELDHLPALVRDAFVAQSG